MDTMFGRNQRYSHFSNDRDSDVRGPTQNWTRYLLSWLCGLMMGVIALSISNHVARNTSPMQGTVLPGALPRVPLQGWVEQHVQRYPEFEAPPAAAAEKEDLWDNLLPRGLGYVIHPEISPNLSVIGVFHALHCLYTIRRAYYASNGTQYAFDLGLERGPHVGHCFDYLRQSLTCTIDPTIEPATKRVFEDENWGFDKQCRSYDEIKAWAERYLAWDVPGTFIPFDAKNDVHM